MRVAVIALCSASLACVDNAARDAGDYNAFRFLEVALSLQLPWSVTRLVYDAAVTLFDAPLPGHRASWAIVAGECVLSCLTYAAGACTLAVQVHLERDVRACAFLAPGACSGYKASALLALSASVFTSAIAARCCSISGFSARPRHGLARRIHHLKRQIASARRELQQTF